MQFSILYLIKKKLTWEINWKLLNNQQYNWTHKKKDKLSQIQI